MFPRITEFSPHCFIVVMDTISDKPPWHGSGESSQIFCGVCRSSWDLYHVFAAPHHTRIEREYITLLLSDFLSPQGPFRSPLHYRSQSRFPKAFGFFLRQKQKFGVLRIILVPQLSFPSRI